MDHYYNAYKTVIRMMADRGYTFNKKNNLSDFKLTMPEFEVKFKGINENKLDIKEYTIDLVRSVSMFVLSTLKQMCWKQLQLMICYS